MRARGFLFGPILLLAVSLGASAQQPFAGNGVNWSGGSASTFLTGVNPHNLPVYNPKLGAPLAKNLNVALKDMNKAFKSPAQPKAFNLGKIFPKVNMLPSWPPAIASTPILTKSPFQPNPLFGKNPFAQTPTK